jgi:hypothetical protein
MRKPRHGLRTGLYLLALVLIGTLAVRTVFAGEAASRGHGDGSGSAARGDGKGSPPPAGESGDRPSSGGHSGEGAAKGDAQPSSSDDHKGQKSGASDRGETPKDTGPSAPPAKDSISAEPSFEPSRRLDKSKSKIGGDNAAARPNFSRRLSPRPQPQPPNSVRNAIGVTLPAHENVERRDSAHPSSTITHPPVAAPVAPGNVTGRLGKTEGASHPISNPVVTPPAANRGAINGTGLTRHNVGPPRIGGPTASVAGVNGTTIRPKH